MPSTFFGINIAKSALLSNQKGMDVTTQNISNANTPGYSRQEVVLDTTIPLYPAHFALRERIGQLGSGVDIAQVSRARDSFLDQQIRNETNNLGFSAGQKEVLQKIERAFLDVSDLGISEQLNNFWNVWQDFSRNPEELSVKTNLVETSVTLAQGFNQLNAHLAQIKDGLVTQRLEMEQETNLLVNNINAINEQVVKLRSSGQEPNDLLDRQDILLEKLAELTDFTTSYADNGKISVTLGGTKGKLAGIVEAEKSLDDYMARVNQTALTLANAVNNVEVDGQSFDFFNVDDTNPAASIKVNQELVGNPANLTLGVSPSKDGEYALKVAQLRHSRTMEIQGANQPTFVSFEDYWQNLIVDIGSKSSQVIKTEENQKALLEHLKTRREEISGVSIDEELVNMMKFQRAFEASSRLMTTLDGMLDTLINRTAR